MAGGPSGAISDFAGPVAAPGFSLLRQAFGGNQMGAWGAIIMSFFGAFFASLTLYWQYDVKGPVLAVPFLVFAAIGLAAVQVLRLPGIGFVPSERAERAIMWSSIGEGLGL